MLLGYNILGKNYEEELGSHPIFSTSNVHQFPLFRYRPDLIASEDSYWLREDTGNEKFACVFWDGTLYTPKASANNGVRPFFRLHISDNIHNTWQE